MSTLAAARPWQLVTLKVPREVLRRIDQEAQRLKLTRTSYMIGKADPKEAA
jgi:hypothetical protein